MTTKINSVKIKVYDLLKGFTFNEIEEVFDYVNKKKEEDKEKTRLSSDFLKKVDKIFELYPECNCIPIAYDYTDCSDIIINNDFNEIWNLCVEYIKTNYDALITPVPVDDMKIGVGREIENVWNECTRMNVVEPKTEKGDYCEYCHYGIYYYDRASGKIKYEGDINN